MVAYQEKLFSGNLPGARVTVLAGDNVDFNTMVYLSAANTVKECSAATDPWVGFAVVDEQADATDGYYASGTACTVELRGPIINILNSDGVTLGTYVEPASGGAVATHTNGTADYKICGIAWETKTTGLRGGVLLI